MSFVAVGDVLAQKYRVDRILGIGGMGMVVAATHLELDQRVALKFMLPDAMLSPMAADRFLREARAAVKLRGEHVCRVLDVGKLDKGAPYIVMEYLEGEDFAHVIARHGVLPVIQSVDHVLQALEGVAEAHAAGIIHRDLKPGNIYVATDSDGSPLVKVLDFGISKSGGGATKTGDVMGSPAYMAPEQMISAKDVDPRADLWAIGVILYHATSGRLPFEGDNIPNLCMSVMSSTPPSLLVVAPHVPPGFAAVVMRCLDKQRENRFTNAGELATALAPFGTPDAAASAARITKVLRRVGGSSGSSAAIAVTQAPSSSSLPAVSPQTPPPSVSTQQNYPTGPGTAPNVPISAAPTPPPPGPATISTIGASAGESIRVPAAVPPIATKPRWPLFAAVGAIAVVGIVVAVATSGGGSMSGDSKPPMVEPAKEPAPLDPPKEPARDPPKDPPRDPPKDPPIDPPRVVEPKREPIMPKIEPRRAGSGKGGDSDFADRLKRAAQESDERERRERGPSLEKRPTQGSAQGSATPNQGTGSGSGYKGTKGRIITEYPPTNPTPAPAPAPKAPN